MGSVSSTSRSCCSFGSWEAHVEKRQRRRRQNSFENIRRWRVNSSETRDDESIFQLSEADVLSRDGESILSADMPAIMPTTSTPKTSGRGHLAQCHISFGFSPLKAEQKRDEAVPEQPANMPITDSPKIPRQQTKASRRINFDAKESLSDVHFSREEERVPEWSSLEDKPGKRRHSLPVFNGDREYLYINERANKTDVLSRTPKTSRRRHQAERDQLDSVYSAPYREYGRIDLDSEESMGDTNFSWTHEPQLGKYADYRGHGECKLYNQPYSDSD